MSEGGSNPLVLCGAMDCFASLAKMDCFASLAKMDCFASLAMTVF